MQMFFGNRATTGRINRRAHYKALCVLLVIMALTAVAVFCVHLHTDSVFYTRRYTHRGFCGNASVSLHTRAENYKPAFYIATVADYYVNTASDSSGRRNLFFVDHYSFDIRHKSLSNCNAYIARANAAIAASVDGFVPCYAIINYGENNRRNDRGLVIGTSDARKVSMLGVLGGTVCLMLFVFCELLVVVILVDIVRDYFPRKGSAKFVYGPVAVEDASITIE
jgi:hypothetical protein